MRRRQSTSDQIIRRITRVRSWRGLSVVLLSIIGLLALELYQNGSLSTVSSAESISCHSPYIIDGDTFDCGGIRVRLAGIDTPEMPGHCRTGRECTPGDPHKARDKLIEMSRGSVTCRQTDIDTYGRTIGRCSVNGIDLSCAMLASGHAVRRYGVIGCSDSESR